MIRSLRMPLLATSLLFAMAAPAFPTVAFAQTAPGGDRSPGSDPTVAELERWVAYLEANPGSIDLAEVKSKLGQIGDKFKQKVGDIKNARDAIQQIEQQIKQLHDQAKDVKNKLKSKSLDPATKNQLERDLSNVRSQIGGARDKLKQTIKQAQTEFRDARQAKQLVQRTSALVNRLLQKAKKGSTPSPEALQALLSDLSKLVADLAEPSPIPPPSPAALDTTGE